MTSLVRRVHTGAMNSIGTIVQSVHDSDEGARREDVTQDTRTEDGQHDSDLFEPHREAFVTTDEV